MARFVTITICGLTELEDRANRDPGSADARKSPTKENDYETESNSFTDFPPTSGRSSSSRHHSRA
jgi:hypothetical protein